MHAQELGFSFQKFQDGWTKLKKKERQRIVRYSEKI
jgi:hypothetical protein